MHPQTLNKVNVTAEIGGEGLDISNLHLRQTMYGHHEFLLDKDSDKGMLRLSVAPERPFVSGSLYHGQNTKGTADGNSLKTIITRSGSTLTFDADAHTILLSTTAANQILIDEKNGTISITSAGEVDVTSKNVHIDASEDMTVNVGKNFNMTVGGDANMTVKCDGNVNVEKDTTVKVAGNMYQKMEGWCRITSKGALEIQTESKAELSSVGTMAVSSQKQLNVKSMDRVEIAKG